MNQKKYIMQMAGDWFMGGIQPMGKVDSEYLARFVFYYIGSDSKRVVYFTFDCGYENGNTELTLDALKRHDAKGTFL